MKKLHYLLLSLVVTAVFVAKAQNWSDAPGVMFWGGEVLTRPPVTNDYDANLQLWFKLNDSPATDPVYSGYEKDSSIYTNDGFLNGNWYSYLTGNLIEVVSANSAGVVKLLDTSYTVPRGEYEVFTNVPNLTSNLVLVGGIQIFTVAGDGEFTNDTTSGYMYDPGPFILGENGNGGLRFTGGNTNWSIESIEVPNSAALQLTNTAGTLMCWCRPLIDGDTTHAFYFFSKVASDPGGGVDGYFFGTTFNTAEPSHYAFFGGVGDQSDQSTNSIYGLSSTNWMHVAMTWDGTSTLRFYTNSVFQCSLVLPVIANPTACTSNLFIGKPQVGSAGLGMDLDDMRIYNTVLTTNQLFNIFTQGAK